MDKIQLDNRDRRNLYREDAQNVVAITTTSDQLDDPDGDVESALSDAVEEMNRTGQRFAYVVVKIER